MKKIIVSLLLIASICVKAWATKLTFGFTTGLRDDPQQLFQKVVINGQDSIVPVVDSYGNPIYQHDYSGKILGAWIGLDAYLDAAKNWNLGTTIHTKMERVTGVKLDDVTVDLAITRIF